MKQKYIEMNDTVCAAQDAFFLFGLVGVIVGSGITAFVAAAAFGFFQ